VGHLLVPVVLGETNTSPTAGLAMNLLVMMPQQSSHHDPGAPAMDTTDEQTLEAGWVRWRHDFHQIGRASCRERVS
jgi:hypothetical protein